MNYIEFLLTFATFQLVVCALVGGTAWIAHSINRRRRARAVGEMLSMNGLGEGRFNAASTYHA